MVTTRKLPIDVLDRPYFNFAVIAEPIESLVRRFEAQGPVSVRPAITQLVFPEQEHRIGTGAPMLLWSPSCTPHLTAFMPHLQSGDYFVVSYAHKKMMLDTISVRSTSSDACWPINEFVAYDGGVRRRIVRTMKDPRWDFFSDGEKLTFEDETKYAARLVRERFTRSDVIRYAQAWGAPVRDPQFWTTTSDAYTFLPVIDADERYANHASQTADEDS